MAETEKDVEQSATDGKKGKTKKKFGPVKTSLCIVSAAAVAAVGTWACIAFLRPQVRNDVDAGYGSVSYEVKKGEVFSASSFVPLKERDETGRVVSGGSEQGYDALDVFGRLNWTFAQQDNWYSEMHSTVDTGVAGDQLVSTYKRYADGILISADITTSSMVNVAREYCYVGDRVIWRDSKDNKKNWDGMNTVFPEGDPIGNMQISGENGFRKKNGLPATELSVYVFEQGTIESAELKPAGTAATADGGELFTISYRLKAKTDKDGKTGAAAYYGNQMVFTGGIDAPPEFKYIEVSYTFTENWLPVSCRVSEAYSASMKTLSTTCSSTSETKFSYDVPEIGEQVQEIYQSYYKEYADKEATGEGVRPLTAADCLASAFVPLLKEPSDLAVTLNVDGAVIEGKVHLDLGGVMSGNFTSLQARLAAGDVFNLWVESGGAYLRYGDVKLSMPLDKLLVLILSGEQTVGEQTASAELDTDALLGALAGGDFTAEGGSARLHSVLPLGETDVTLDFLFDVAEKGGERTVSLGSAEAAFTVGGKAIGASVVFTEDGPTPLPQAQKADYIDVSDYVTTLRKLFTSDYFHADLRYDGDGASVTAALDLCAADGSLQGEIAAELLGVTKTVGVSFDGKTAYVDADGVKVKADAAEIASLLQSYLPAAAEESGSFDLKQLIETVFDPDFAAYFRSSEEENALQLTLKGTEILKALGVEFSLGDLVLGVDENGLTASVYGIAATVTEGHSFSPDTQGYTDLSGHADDLIALFTGDALTAQAAYTDENNLSLTGTVTLSLTDYAAHGTFVLTAGEKDRTVEIDYLPDGYVCVGLGGVRLKGSVEKVSALLSQILSEADSGAPAAASAEDEQALRELLKKLLALRLGDSLQITADENALTAVVKTADLCAALGLGSDLGDLTLSVTAQGIEGSTTGGATFTVVSGGTLPAVDLSSYIDADGAAEALSAIVAAQGLSFEGGFTLNVNGTEVALYLENGGISWKNGFELRADLVFTTDSAVLHRVSLYSDGESLKLLYGKVGAQLVYGDLGALEEAFTALKDKIKTEVLDPMLGAGEGTAAAYTLAESGGALADFAQTLADLIGELRSGNGETDLNAILDKIEIVPSQEEGGLLSVRIAGFTADLIADGGLSVKAGFTSDQATVEGSAGIAPLETLSPMPEGNYLSTPQFLLAVDYLGSAVGLASETDISLTIEGTTQTLAADGSEAAETVKYNIAAALNYHRGEAFPLRLDVDGKNLWVESDVYLNVSVTLAPEDSAATGLYLDLFILDAAPAQDGTASEEAVADGNLDFYVSVSKFGKDTTAVDGNGESKYVPLRIHAPADEIMTLLSGAVSLLGVNSDLLDSYLVSKWLELESVEQLKELGDALKPLLQGLLGGASGGDAQTDGVSPAAVKESAYLKRISVEENAFTLVLDSAEVYGKTGLSDLTVTLTREDKRFTGVSFENVYDGAAAEVTSLTGEIVYGAFPAPKPEGTYRNFPGAEKLLLSLAKSATHAAEGDEVMTAEPNAKYVLNRNFYIDGSVTVALKIGRADLVDITIKVIAVSVSVDADGKVGLNLRLEYDGEYNGALLLAGIAGIDLDGYIINGDSTLDLTLKDGMVYMKRVQTSDFGGPINTPRDNIAPITLYRAMPAENFTADIFGQLGFMFNFGDKLWTYIMSQVNSSTGDGGTQPEPTAEVTDYGARLNEVLKEYVYTPAADDKGDTWSLTLNGNALAENVLGDLTVTISNNREGYIHDLSVTTKLVNMIDVSASLSWHNPGGVMEADATGAPVKDITADVSEEILNGTEKENQPTVHGMGGAVDRLNESGWAEKQFLEAAQYAVTYAYTPARGGAETTIDSLTEIYLVSSGNDGNAKNTLYSDGIGVKDLSYLTDKEYEYSCNGQQSYEAGQVLPQGGGLKYSVTQSIRKYAVRFRSQHDFGEGWTLADDGTYTYEIDMEYGSVIEVAGVKTTVTGETTVEIPEAPTSQDGRTGSWQGAPEITGEGAVFQAVFASNVTYRSKVQFTLQDGNVEKKDGVWECETEFSATDYTLPTPAAEGYIFLGWFVQSGESWTGVTQLNAAESDDVVVEALWVSDNVTVTIVKAERQKLGTFSYNYNLEVSLTGGNFDGAPKKIATMSVTYQIELRGLISRATYTSEEERFSAEGVRFEAREATITVTIVYQDGYASKTVTTTVKNNDWTDV